MASSSRRSLSYSCSISDWRCTLHAQQEKKVTWRQARVRRRSNNLGLWLRTVCCKNAWPQDDSAAVSGPAFLDLSVLETAHAREKTQVSAAAQQGKPERWSSATGRCFLLALPFTPFKIPFLLRSTVTVGASQCQKRELTGKGVEDAHQARISICQGMGAQSLAADDPKDWAEANVSPGTELRARVPVEGLIPPPVPGVIPPAPVLYGSPCAMPHERNRGSVGSRISGGGRQR